MEIQFYDVKTRRKVGVPTSRVRKARREQQLKKGGTRTVYALRGSHDGRTLTKFCSRSDWETLDVPEE